MAQSPRADTARGDSVGWNTIADVLRWKFHLFLSEPGSARFAKVNVKWVYGMKFPWE